MDPNSSRKPYKILPPETWKQIRRDYESGTPADLLCRQYGVSQSTLFSRRLKEGWIRNDRPVGGEPGHACCIQSVSAGHPQGNSMTSLEGPADAHGGYDEAGGEHALTGGAAPMPPNSEIVPVGDPVAVNRSHLSLASALRHRIGQLAGDDRLGAGPQGRMSRSAVDLATAIEKLQKIERKALEMDNGQPVNNVQMVILAPAKMDPEEWASHALDGHGTQVG